MHTWYCHYAFSMYVLHFLDTSTQHALPVIKQGVGTMELVYNLTGIDLDAYFAVNTTANVLLFLTIVLPAFVLCLFCVVALLFTPEIKCKIKFLIINLFASEISNWLMYSIIFLGFPSRYQHQDIDDVSCRMFSNLLIIVGPTKHLGTAFYSAVVYVYLKYGLDFVPWLTVIIGPVIIWMVLSFFGLLSYTDEYLYNNAGFCERDAISSPHITVIPVIAGSALCLTLVFAFLTFRYIRKNTFEDADVVKKYIGKHLLYMTMSSFLGFIINMLPATYAPLRAALVDQPIVSIFLIHYFLRGIYALLWLLTPIATVAVLKPVRLTMKNMLLGRCRISSPTYNEEGPPADIDPPGPSAVRSAANEEEHQF